MGGQGAPTGAGAAGAALAALAALAGVALQLQQPALWPDGIYALMLAAALAAGLAARRLGGPAAPLLFAAACAAAGFSSTGWRAHERLSDRLDARLEGLDLELVGVVARLPQSGLTGTRFVFDVESATRQGQAVRVPQRLALGWYRGPDADALLVGPLAELRAGQRWRLLARLRRPHGSFNPGGFDSELWLFEQGIGASGTVRSRAGALAVKLADDAGYPVERLRQRLRDAIDDRVPDAAAAGVLAALAIGDQGAIDRADWDLFRVTGVAHLMSISGLHVTMFAWLAGLAIGRAWRLWSRGMLWLPAPRAAAWGGLLAAAAYAVLAGWGVPAQRTVGMIAVVVALRSLGLRWPQPLVLLAAAVVVVAADPWAMLQPGFWLSFVAVALLVGSAPVQPLVPAGHPAPTLRARLAEATRAALHTQLVASVGLTPLTLLFFQQVSVVGFVANLVAIPLVTLAITPLALLGLLLPALWVPAAALVSALLKGLALLAAWPLAVWTAPAAPAWAAALGLAGGALLVAPLPWRLRLLGLPMWLPLLLPSPQRPPDGRFELLAADIGQGNAVLVRTRDHLLVYDTGPQYSPESDAGQRVLLPLLRARGEARIDLLMLSHRDSDHTGGAASLLAHHPVAALSSSLAPEHPLRAGTMPHARCEAGQRWRWDGVDFEVLHPEAEEHRPGARPNTLSCVLRVQAVDGSAALLTGDIEAAQELALLERRRPALVSTVLLVPHHGSRTSSSTPFIDAVAPRIALVQAGYRSRFGHPAPDVVQRYAERGITLVRSDRCGAWSWTGGDAGEGRCSRDTGRRYWHASP